MKNYFSVLFVFIALPCLAQKDLSTRYANIITPAALKAKLSVLASAEMEGRETATIGQKRAAAFIEDNFKRSGLFPAASTGYQVHFGVSQDTLMNVSLRVDGKAFPFIRTFSFGRSGAPHGNYTINEVVFVGKGDSTTVAGLQLKNKWVMLDGDINRAVFNEATRILNAKGVKGYILVSKSFPSATAALKGSIYLKPDAINRSLPRVYVSYEVASAILHDTISSSASLLKIAPATYTATISLDVIKKTLLFESTNVIGVLPGTDKKNEYVFLTAHYDHIGKRGDIINYGADDNGSGTSSLLQMAEAFAKAKAEGKGPRRSIVFMAMSGEEEGLLGSEFYANHPLFPFDKTSVDLNTDMIGRIETGRKADSNNYIYTIGENRLSSDLVRITDSVIKKYSKLTVDRKYNLNDPSSYYTRSDHYNFAKNGVPIIFYFNGVHADYHKPTDTIEKINFDLMSKRVKLIFHTAWMMANREKMLSRDLPL